MTARAPQSSRGGVVPLSDGKTNLPFLIQQKQQQQQLQPPLALPSSGFLNTAAAISTSTSYNVVVAHGLGMPDPSQKTHLNDISYDLWQDCQPLLQGIEIGSTVLYTARGHGKSYGWEPTSSSEELDLMLAKEAFTWPALAHDLADVIRETLPRDSPTRSSTILFGQSMGAATALYYAMMEDRVKIDALILARLPRIWESRQEVAHEYVQSAQEYKQQHPQQNRFHHLPILGASLTDLPPKGDIQRWNCLKDIPILLLCHGNDTTHPVESGQLLQKVLPHSTLHDFAIDEEQARELWPSHMADWLEQQLQ